MSHQFGNDHTVFLGKVNDRPSGETDVKMGVDQRIGQIQQTAEKGHSKFPMGKEGNSFFVGLNREVDSFFTVVLVTKVL